MSAADPGAAALSAGTSQRQRERSGLLLATVSAAAFGSSGPMGKALIDAGWSPAAAVLLRLGGSAVLLLVVAVLLERRRLRLDRARAKVLVIYGVVAMAGVQLSYFNAVRTLDVGVALLLEYLAPVLLLAWSSLRTRQRPPLPTLAGATLTLVGLVLVLDLAGARDVDPVGVAWGLSASICLAGYFTLSARQDADLPPLVMAAGGTLVGALTLLLAGLLGVVDLTATTDDAVLAGTAVSVLLPAAWLVLISTSTAYLTGIAGVLRLGARSASFVSLSEVLFAILVAWLVLSELPGPIQLVGGASILTGIVLIQRDERGAPELTPRAT
ncbi:MAG: EamA family transporter [Nitriliruptoraceae bacterium]